MRNDRERIQDICEAIAKIERYAVQGRAEFLNDELILFYRLLFPIGIYPLEIAGETLQVR